MTTNNHPSTAAADLSRILAMCDSPGGRDLAGMLAHTS